MFKMVLVSSMPLISPQKFVQAVKSKNTIFHVQLREWLQISHESSKDKSDF